MIEWFSVKEHLPNHGERVLIYNGGVDVATFKRGISEEEREKMRKGELPDYAEEGWCATLGHTSTRRSLIYKAYDEWANNLFPYGWDVRSTILCGQDVSHWAYFNTPEQYKEQRIKEVMHNGATKLKDKRYLNCKYLDAGMDGMLCSMSLCTTCKEFNGEKCPYYTPEKSKE